MMKRAAALLLTMLYLITAMGFVLNFHYCFNRVSSVQLNVPAKKCNLVADCKFKCCKDKHFEIKVKDAHQAQFPSFINKITPFELPWTPHAETPFLITQPFLNGAISRGPPFALIKSNNILVENSVFRI